jgi:hypothetical protein
MKTFKTVLFAIVAAFILFSGSTFLHHPEVETEVYCNTRFNYCLRYPEGVFEEIEHSSNEDGIRAYSEDGKTQFIVAGFYNTLGTSIDEEYDMSIKNIEYEQGEIISATTEKNPDWFETIVETKNTWVYQKVIKANDHYLSLTIKTDKKTALEKLKAQIFFTNQL